MLLLHFPETLRLSQNLWKMSQIIEISSSPSFCSRFVLQPPKEVLDPDSDPFSLIKSIQHQHCKYAVLALLEPRIKIILSAEIKPLSYNPNPEKHDTLCKM